MQLFSKDEEERLISGHYCWHCRYYIRPIEMMVDGPISSVCAIDRTSAEYAVPGEMVLGDKKSYPDNYCERFEMDKPPTEPTLTYK